MALYFRLNDPHNRDIVLGATKLTDDNGKVNFVDELDIPILFYKPASGQPDGTGMDQPYLQMSSTHNGEWEDTGKDLLEVLIYLIDQSRDIPFEVSGTQNVICVTVNNNVQTPSGNWEWFDTSFGTVIMREGTDKQPQTQESACLSYGDFMRPFVPKSSIENDWYYAWYHKVQFSSIF